MVFPLSFLGTLSWKQQCMSWNLSLWTSWEHGYENCSACHGVLTFEPPGNIVMKTSVHIMVSFPWASWKRCHENCSACHGVFPLSFLGTLLWKLQCMSWSLSLWASWEHYYENCNACHGVSPFELPGNIVMKTAVHVMESFPLNFLGTLLWKLQCMSWSISLSVLGTLLRKLQCITWSLSLELSGNIVMKTAVHVNESFPWASCEHCYKNCRAWHWVFPLSFLGTLLWKPYATGTRFCVTKE